RLLFTAPGERGIILKGSARLDNLAMSGAAGERTAFGFDVDDASELELRRFSFVDLAIGLRARGIVRALLREGRFEEDETGLELDSTVDPTVILDGSVTFVRNDRNLGP